MNRRALITSVVGGIGLLTFRNHAAAQPAPASGFAAPGEFEPQEYIWLSWIEKGSLGSAPFSDVALDVMRAITPHVKVRLMYSSLTAEDSVGGHSASAGCPSLTR